MTREEEIKKRLFEISTSNFNNSVVDSSAYFAGYTDGAKWADRTMVEKACEWLEDFIKWNDLCTLEDIEQFRKAMKGD